MPVGTQGQTQAPTPRSLSIDGQSAAALQTAIDAQTKILNDSFRSPYAGQPSGNVLNDSIVVSDTRVWVANNVPTYQATVHWTEFVTV